MLRLGKFTEAIERGDERRSSLRKENAQMYADFVRDNPGASVEERTDYAQTLINDTGVGNKGLPTRASMKRSVDKYKKAEAAKAASAARAAENRKQAGIRQRLTDVNTIISNAAALGEDEEYVKGLLTEFGYDVDGVDNIMTQVKDTQFQDWQQDNSAAIQNYLNNPTKAGYDLLLSRGTGYEENIASLFESQYKSSEEKLRRNLVIDLEALSDAKDEEDYERQLRILQNKYPDAVFSQAANEVNRIKGLFEGNMATRVAEELRKMEVELRQLSSTPGLSTKEYQDQKKAIYAKYSSEAQTQAKTSNGDAQSLDAKTNFRYDDLAETEQANKRTNWDASVDAKLVAKVLEPGLTEAGLNAEFALIAADAQEKGYLLPDGWSEKYTTVFNDNTQAAKTKKDNILDQKVDVAVTEQADAAVAAAAADTDIDKVVADLEKKLTADLGEGNDIKLTEAQKTAIQSQIDLAKEQIKKNVAALGTGMENNSAAYQDVLNRTREEFIKDFAEQLGTSDAGGIVNAQERFGDIASETYDNIVAAVREQANAEEEIRIAKSVSDMNADRSDFDAGKAKDLFDERMVNPAVYGTGDAEDRASIGAEISTSLFAQAQTFANETGIPLTEEVYTRFVNLLQATVEKTHVPGEPFDRAIVREKLQLAVQETFDTSENYDIEKEAYDRALVKAGIRRLDEGDDVQLTLFKIEYEKLRTELATKKFDRFGSSFADDVERSVPLITASDNIVTENTGVLDEASALADQMLALDGRDFLTSTLPEALVASHLALRPIPGKLEIAAYDLKSEIRRLTALQRTDVYKNSENKPAVVAKIEELTAALTKVSDQSAAIADFMVRFDETKKKGKQEIETDLRMLEEARVEIAAYMQEQQRNSMLLGGARFNKAEFFNLEVPPGYENVEDFANTYEGRAWKEFREKGLLSLQ